MLKPVVETYRLVPNARKYIWAGIFSTFFLKVCEVIPDVLLGLMIDAAFRKDRSFLSAFGVSPDLRVLYGLGAITVVVLMASNVFQYFSALKWKDASREIQFKLRLDFTRAMMGKEGADAADLREDYRATNVDLENVGIYFSRTLEEAFRICFACLLAGPVLYWISPEFLLYSLFSVAIALVVSITMQRRVAPLSDAVKTASKVMHVRIDDTINGLSIAKDFGVEARLFEKIESAANTLKEKNEWVSRVNAAVIPLSRAPIQLGLCAILIDGIVKATHHEITFGSFAAAAFLSRRFLLPLTFLGNLVESCARGSAELSDVLVKLKNTTATARHAKAFALPKNTEPLSITNLDYAYGDRKILSGLTVSFQPEVINVIRGRTGIGKTTFLRLLKRDLPIDSGKIQYGDRDFEELCPTAWQRHLAYAPQRPILFSASVLDNITLFDPEVDAVALERALKFSLAGKFVTNLPEGIATIIGGGGVPLSGGQTQSISLARALYTDAKIFFFDEPTAAMDLDSERKFLEGLRTLREGRLILMTSHRSQTIDSAEFLFELA